jgi:hypothetical protein
MARGFPKFCAFDGLLFFLGSACPSVLSGALGGCVGFPDAIAFCEL